VVQTFCAARDGQLSHGATGHEMCIGLGARRPDRRDAQRTLRLFGGAVGGSGCGRWAGLSPNPVLLYTHMEVRQAKTWVAAASIAWLRGPS
jgi:hypothetical protein